ncbi:MAG: UDP-N-acetylglucosamine 1-carboxyvinyltransferase [Solobacterium sp.]|nr:UDP-N-acetylglucosamine 1-carboxyvinyltransferase [Solobacterium sp.]MDY4640171.1 UDP-N-acetylglucosamine 1-carboxyvinyltransferase [Erysipelotrichaceae bacterium]
MENKLVIKGGKKLRGEVTISSSKNAAVAILPAVVLGSEIVKLYDVPHIEDVHVLIQLLQELNINVTTDKNNALVIDPTDMNNIVLCSRNVSRLRASYYFMGALLSRYRYVKMLYPGGCNLGPRPIDLHLKGFEALGAKVTLEGDYIEIKAEELIGDEIYLDFASVGATINIMLAATLARGRTIIANAAKEPEIIDLSSMLNKMGARIHGAGTSKITIDGVSRLKGCIHEIIPDRIEAGTYISLAAAIGDGILVKNVIPQHIEALLSKLEEMGVDYNVTADSVYVFPVNKTLKPIEITTQTFPGFATDLQQPITPLLMKADGVSLVQDKIYPERFKHCEQLNKMGGRIVVNDGKAVIYGNGNLKLAGNNVRATDLRCGAGLIIAALMAEGETVIDDAYHIFRGYSNIVEKLSLLGADVQKI